VVGRRLFLAFLLGAIGAGLPAAVLAHPLGNFTINHSAGITFGRVRVVLDVVIDMGVIP
jgi:type IV secretory pathway protease TraF